MSASVGNRQGNCLDTKSDGKNGEFILSTTNLFYLMGFEDWLLTCTWDFRQWHRPINKSFFTRFFFLCIHPQWKKFVTLLLFLSSYDELCTKIIFQAKRRSKTVVSCNFHNSDWWRLWGIPPTFWMRENLLRRIKQKLNWNISQGCENNATFNDYSLR